jgi:RNA polymerase sigma-70 factor, ECF subfamily
MTVTAALQGWTDAELAAASLSGDRQAFDELVCRYRAGVVGVVYRMSGDPNLAEEAAQEAFVRAWQNLHSYKTSHPFRSWVYRIAINAALDSLRQQTPLVELENLDLPSPEIVPEDSLEEQERARAVRQAVLALPAASRAVLVLREYEGLTYAEIAAALDIPSGTVMSRLSYARNLLRQSLAAYLET